MSSIYSYKSCKISSAFKISPSPLAPLIKKLNSWYNNSQESILSILSLFLILSMNFSCLSPWFLLITIRLAEWLLYWKVCHPFFRNLAIILNKLKMPIIKKSKLKSEIRSYLSNRKLISLTIKLLLYLPMILKILKKISLMLMLYKLLYFFKFFMMKLQ